MKETCNVCGMCFCLEAQMDQTEGCCLCYNQQMVREDGQEITLCVGCKEHLKLIKCEIKS